jgi:iron(III) transport system ATP-binding protein
MSGFYMEGIAHAFGSRPVVAGVSLDVKRGELACLLGPSGCGKTTLLRLAAGLEPLQHGRVIIDGEIVANAADGCHVPPEKRRIGLMFQDYALFPHLTLTENIRFGLDGVSTIAAFRIDEAMARIGLAPFADAYPHTLSGGQQQRVALLRALAPGPRVLLLDEPFSDLDVNRRVQVRESTLELLKESGAATLIVTHDPEEAMFMADRILVMDAGRIVQSGPPFDIYFHPTSAFVAELFGPVNRLPGVVRGHAVDTPIGRFEAAGVADGRRVDILVRVEGIKVRPDGEADGQTPIVARVVSSRLLGRSSHLSLRVPAGYGEDVALQCRVPGVLAFRPGDTVRLGVDRDLSFIFPA